MERVFTVVVTMGQAYCSKQIKALKQEPRCYIVLVLNGCAEPVNAFFQELVGDSGHCIILPHNEGGAGGFRAGMSYVVQNHPDTEYVWLLDDDAEINDTTLSELLKTAHEFDHQGIRWGVIGSMIVSAEYRTTVVESGASLNLKKGEFNANNRGKHIKDIPSAPIPCQYCAAASLLTKTDVIREVGIFADIFLHYDDVEWCLRVQKSGYSIFCAPSSVIHHPTNISKPATWVRYYDAANYIWICRKHFPGVLVRTLFLQYFKQFYFYIHGLRKTARLYRYGIRDGLRGETRLKRNVLQVEEYINVNPEEWEGQKLFVTDHPKHAVIFRRRFGNNTKIILLNRKWWLRFFIGIYANFQAILHSSMVSVLDDSFRNRKLLPLFGRNTFYYNIQLNKKVDK